MTENWPNELDPDGANRVAGWARRHFKAQPEPVPFGSSVRPLTPPPTPTRAAPCRCCGVAVTVPDWPREVGEVRSAWTTCRTCAGLNTRSGRERVAALLADVITLDPADGAAWVVLDEPSSVLAERHPATSVPSPVGRSPRPGFTGHQRPWEHVDVKDLARRVETERRRLLALATAPPGVSPTGDACGGCGCRLAWVWTDIVVSHRGQLFALCDRCWPAYAAGGDRIDDETTRGRLLADMLNLDGRRMSMGAAATFRFTAYADLPAAVREHDDGDQEARFAWVDEQQRRAARLWLLRRYPSLARDPDDEDVRRHRRADAARAAAAASASATAAEPPPTFTVPSGPPTSTVP